MASYTRLNVSELKELCNKSGISPEGRKADLVAALKERDRKAAEVSSLIPDETADGEMKGKMTKQKCGQITLRKMKLIQLRLTLIK